MRMRIEEDPRQRPVLHTKSRILSLAAAPALKRPELPAAREALFSAGRTFNQLNPLDAATRSFMEPRFGHDFSGVRVHTMRG